MESKKLPVYKIEEKLISLLKEHQVIVVEGVTGSGKSTQIPQILYKHGAAVMGRIGVTQPRRIACVSVAGKIAEDLNTEVGKLVGIKMRFYDITSPETKIKIMTDGILIQEIQNDPMLSEYDIIMVDEAHERSLNIDIILGLLKQILKKRPDFRVIISSATIRPKTFSDYFNNAPIVHIDVKPYPIKVRYTNLNKPSLEMIIDEIVKNVERIVYSKNAGDILIFLPGENEIKQCMYRLSERIGNDAVLLPLYSRLAKEEQDYVFLKFNKPKVVIATNIAETSVTIEDIKYVIDCGLEKVNEYNPKTHISSLILKEISQASCEQRKGRTGRTAPGVCIRLYTKSSYLRRPKYKTEEIKRANLAEVVLRMLSLGIYDIENFDFISKPPLTNIKETIKRLKRLNAITEDRTLTEIGWKMVSFPLDPEESRMIIESIQKYPDVLYEILVVVAFISTKPPFLLPLGEERIARKKHDEFAHPYGDFVSYLNIFSAYKKAKNKEEFCKEYYFDIKIMEEIENIVEQLEDIVSNLGYEIKSGGKTDNIIKCIATGLSYNICVKEYGKSYKSLYDTKIFLHPGSFLKKNPPKFIVAGEIVKTSRKFARQASLLKKEWLKEVNPYLYSKWVSKEEAKKEKKSYFEDNFIDFNGHKLRVKGSAKKRYIPIDFKTLKKIISDINPEKLRVFYELNFKIYYNNFIIFNKISLYEIFLFLKNTNFNIKLKTKFNDTNDVMFIDRDFSLIVKLLKEFFFFAPRKKNAKRLKLATMLNNQGKTFWIQLYDHPIDSVIETLDSVEKIVLFYEQNLKSSPPSEILNLMKTLKNIVEGKL